MSVESLYTDTDQKDATKKAVIAGIELGEIYQVNWQFAIGRVPTATIIIPNPTPVFADYFADVTIDAGFNGLTERVFTGKVMNIAANERQTEIACAGLSQFLDKPSEDATLLIDDTTNIVVLNAIFALAGISFFEIALPTTALGTEVVSELQFQSFAEAIDKVAELDGGRWAELPTGLIRVFIADPIPQASTNRTYFTMNLTGLVESRPAGLLTGRPRIRTLPRRHDVAKVKNRIHVRGATIDVEQPDGSELSEDIERTVSGPSPYVLNPDGSQAFNDMLFSNELVDNDTLADAIAARLLSVNNRRVTVLNPTVDGDPLRRLGESIRVEDESYPIVSGRFFLEGYRTVMGQSDFLTQLTLLGEGTVIDQDPVAQVSICQMMSIVIDDRRYTIVTFDARGSFSPSGAAITAYSWTDNQTPVVATGTDAVISVRIDPAGVSPEPWTVALTITDGNGNQDTVSIEIDPDECGDDCVTIATLFAALETDSSGSPDGGEAWNDDSQNSISSAAHPSTAGLAVFGTATGQIYRTTDYALSVALATTDPAANPIRDIIWDVDDPTNVWALTSVGAILRSTDEGLTWAALPGPSGLINPAAGGSARRIKLISGSLIVVGGAGSGTPLIAVDGVKDDTWTAVVQGGDLAADLAAGTPDNAIFVADFAVDQLWRMGIILNDSAFEPSVYYTTDLFGDGSQWARATGLPAGKFRGRWMEADLEEDRFVFQYDDTVVYLGDVTAGVMAVTVAAAALDAGDSANHGMHAGGPHWAGHVPGLGAVYLISGEGAVDGTIYISWDRFANIGKVRPATGFPAAPAGANAQMTKLGAPGLCPELYAQEETPSKITARLRAQTWEQQSSQAGTNNWHLIQLGGVLYRIANAQTTSRSGGWGDLERSTDEGATWNIVIGQNVPLGDGINTVSIGPDGVLWAGTRTTFNTTTPFAIFRSTDNGLTWAQVITGFEGTAGDHHRAQDIAIDPFNANIIVIACERALNNEVVLVSTDGGGTWVSQAGPAGFTGRDGFWIAFGDDGRLLAATEDGLYTSDDLGASWIQRDAQAADQVSWLIRGPSVDQFLYALELPGAPQWSVMRSLDNGQTWEELVNEEDLYTATGQPLWSGAFLQDGSVVIGTRPNATDAGTPVTIWKQANPFAPTVPAFATWENWTYNWHTLNGSGLGLQSLTSILVEGH